MRKILFILIISFYFFEPSFCACFSSDDIGTTSASVLKIIKGPKSIAMGGAFCAANSEMESIYYNPAGLYGLKNLSITAMHTMWFQNIYFDQLSLAYPVSRGSVLAISASYLGMDDIDKFLNTGLSAGSSYSPYDLVITASYAQSLKSRSVLGLNVKMIQSVIDDESAIAYAADIAYNRKDVLSGLNMGFAIQNLGTKIKFIEEEIELPVNFCLGLAYNGIVNGLTLMMDANFPNDNDGSLNFGAEYYSGFSEEIGMSFRSGYKTSTIEDIDMLSGLSAGAGFNLYGLNIDYAWVPYGDLGNTNRFSMTYLFPTGKKKPKNLKIKSEEEKSPVQKVVDNNKKKEKYPELPLFLLTPDEIMERKRHFFFKAHDLFSKGSYEKSIKEFEKVLGYDPAHEESKKYIKRAKEELNK